MATQDVTVEFILGKLRERERFTARAMFGEQWNPPVPCVGSR
jgi:hypothetical protein